MKKVLAALALLPCLTVAADNFYFGLRGHVHEGEFAEPYLVDDPEDTNNPPKKIVVTEPHSVDFQSFSVFGGFELTDFLAAEFRAGVGDDDTYIDVESKKSEAIELNYYIGAYLKPQVKMDNGFTPYVMFGVTRVQYDIPNEPSLDNETGLSYGVGISYSITENIAIGLEFMSMLERDEAELNSTSIGLSYTF
ncbi:porin family protein [Ferrimonas senticii]|uniref:porin family protein n=1 Tax=Ferrimonas senticii TaxID=394566 RepID=UPI000484F2F1|nr:porin family protein [Ferrimonas senticii]